MSELIKIAKMNKSYDTGSKKLRVLKDIDLTVERGDLVSIIGKSCSGKSTLLNMIGMLDNYDSGDYWFDDHLINNISESKAAHYRNKYIGFVFQTFHLIGTKTALENVALPLMYQDVKTKERNERAMMMLEKVGLGDRTHHLPNELSGGQKQRVAIARALVTHADLVLADEPTGALDSKTSEEILNLLLELNQEGQTVMIVTHEDEVADACKTKIEISDGEIISKMTMR